MKETSSLLNSPPTEVCYRVQPKRMQKIDWKKWIDRSLDLVRAGIDAYIGIKRKEPVYLMSSVSKISEVINDCVSEKNASVSIVMAKLGFKRILEFYIMRQFLVDILHRLDLPNTVFLTGNKQLDSTYLIKEYDLGTVTVYIATDKECSIDNQSNCQEVIVYINCEEKVFFDAFNKKIIEVMGTNLRLVVTTRNWNPIMSLEKAVIDDNLETYVSSVDLEGFTNNLGKFHKLNYNRSFLLYGPPGTGKTTFANLVSKTSNGIILTLDCNSMDLCIDKNIGLNTFSDLINPSIILFDDLDRVHNIQLLLSEVEILNKNRGKNLTIFGAINSLTALPSALRRPGRFDEIVEFPLPDDSTRVLILRSYLKHFDLNLAGSAIYDVVTQTKGLSGAELREIALQIKINGYDAAKIEEKCAQMLQMKKIMKTKEENEHLDHLLDEIQ